MLQSNALIVDNSQLLRTYVREILQQELGFNEIHEAGDAGEAMRLLQSGRIFNWIFSSQEISGLALQELEEIATRGASGMRPRMVLMSASDEHVIRENAIRQGAADYLCTPFVPGRLVDVVHRLTGLAERRSAERFKVALACEINIGFDSFHHYGGELSDISLTGCRMKISPVKPGSGHAGDYATVTLLLGKGSPVDIQARIKRVEFNENCADPLRNTEVAVEFVELISPVRKKLESFIELCRESACAAWQ